MFLTFVSGRNQQQKEAFAKHEAFKLANWDASRAVSEGALFYEEWISDKVSPLWNELAHAFPEECEHVLRRVPEQYRLEGTGFTKVTLGEDNPTPMHVDNNNFGLTALLAIDVSPQGCMIRGGSHVVHSVTGDRTVVFKDSRLGLLFLGDYTRILHGNLATQCGRRLILTAYCGMSIIDRHAKKELCSSDQTKGGHKREVE